MSQNAARHDSRAKAEDDDFVTPQPRQSEHEQRVRPRRPVGQPDGDGGLGPDEPDEGEFELIGGDDLGPVDLGPANPNAKDPDASSGRPRR